MRRRITIVALTFSTLLGAVGVGPAAASAPAGPSQDARWSAPATLHVSVAVRGFSTRGRHAVAHALATATLTNFSGQVSRVRQRVTLSAAGGGSCQVLHLFLQRLNLNLLGLNARLDKVVLDITGRARGGALGALFCRLSRGLAGNKGVGKKAAARALTARLRRHPMYAARFAVRVAPQSALRQAAAAPASCQILDLVLGPLNLNLLGLQVDLNQVHLNVTATQGAGVLGNLFCSLANGTPRFVGPATS